MCAWLIPGAMFAHGSPRQIGPGCRARLRTILDTAIKITKARGPHPGAKTEREAQGRAPGGWALAHLGHGDMDYHPQEGQCPSPPETWEKSNLSNAWSWEVLVKCSQAHLKAQLRFCNQTLFHSGVAFSQRQQEGVGLLLSPWPTAWILGFSPVDEKLVSEYL